MAALPPVLTATVEVRSSVDWSASLHAFTCAAASWPARAVAGASRQGATHELPDVYKVLLEVVVTTTGPISARRPEVSLQ